MAQKSKLQKEYQVEEDGTTVVPKEILPQVAPTMLKKSVKRERSEAQKANFAKVVAANKERWAKLRDEKDAAAAKAKEDIKADHQEKIDLGTHVRVFVKDKKVLQPRKQKEPETLIEPDCTSDGEEAVVVKPVKRVVKKRVVYETDTDTDTPTETESESEFENYKQGKRQIRREVKKNIRAIERIDSVVQATGTGNPYAALLASRWK